LYFVPTVTRKLSVSLCVFNFIYAERDMSSQVLKTLEAGYMQTKVLFRWRVLRII
jgi:hypothetical protein